MPSPDQTVPPDADPQVADDRRRISIGAALNGNDNALGFIRLVLAGAVIFDHAFPLGGFGQDPFSVLTRGQASLGSIAVGGFFAISGYLIAKSGMSGDVVQFMWRRTLRIFPAYWLVLLFTAFIVGPLIWLGDGHALTGYFVQGENGPVHYFTANWTLDIGTYGIHDLLKDTTPYGRSFGASIFNGSIWTLIYEWRCYLIIAVLVMFGVLRSARIVVPLLTAFFLVLQVVAIVDFSKIAAIIPTLADQYMIYFGLTFFVGSSIALYSQQIPFDNLLGILAGFVMLATLRWGGFSTVGTIAGVYFVIYLAARLPRQTHWVGRKNDYSYGVYIYGFLVQQVTAYLKWNQLGYLRWTLICTALSLGFAWLSWNVIEKRVMALKGWGPGRGWRYWRDWLRVRSTPKGSRV